MTDSQQQQNSTTTKAKKKNEKTVTDPITHLPLTIHDHDELELEQVPPASSKIESTDDKSAQDEKRDADERQEQVDRTIGDVTSKLYMQGGLSDRDGERKMYGAVIVGVAVLSAVVVVQVVEGVLGRWAVGVAVAGVAPLWAWLAYVYAPLPSGAKVEGDGAHREEDDHDQKDSSSSTLTANEENEQKKDDSEPTAWLNALLTSLWPIINPALFVSISDMIEDQMQATLPPFIHGLRVADLGQGAVPAHIVSLLALPPGDASKEIEGMTPEEGDFINFELCIAYRGNSSSYSRGGNAHLLIEFVTVGGLTIPTWISLTSLLMDARVRVQLTPNPPFLRLATLSLTGRPQISFICTPLAKRRWLDVMDVPGLAPWVKSCVNAAVEGFIAPRSLTLDIPELLGMGVGLDVDSAGVIWVKLGRAWGMRKGDAVKVWKRSDESKGDVYVTVGWAKWGKRVWASRVIHEDSNPVWNQETAVVVGNTEISAGERLRIQLWDSDRMTADDLLGTLDIPLSDLMSDAKKGKMEDREDKLLSEKEAERLGGQKHSNGDNHEDGVDADVDVDGGRPGVEPSHPDSKGDSSNTPSSSTSASTDSSSTSASSSSSKARRHKHGQGTISFSVGFFPKTGLVECMDDDASKASEFEKRVMKDAEGKLREDMSKQAFDDEAGDAQTEKRGGPEDDNEGEEGEGQGGAAKSKGGKERSEVEQLKEEDLKERTDEMIASRPPSRNWPSGILQVQIEAIEGLEIEDVRGPGEKAGEGVEGEGEDDEAGRKKPSAYVDIIVNCERWYKTRVKVRDGKPYFNAGTERFIRSWPTTSILIAVRDSRLHEADPLLGVLSLPLSRILSSQSHIEQSYPLIGGVGRGRVKTRITFRSVRLQLPRELRGWDVGTVVVQGDVKVVSNDGVGMIGEELRKCRLVVRAVCAKGKFVPFDPEGGHGGGVMKWRKKEGRRENKQGKGEDGKESLREVKLPVQRRYTECVVFEWRRHEKGVSKGLKKMGHEMVVGFAVVWLSDLVDSPPEHESHSSSPDSNSEEEEDEKKDTIECKIWSGGSGLERARRNRTEEGLGDEMKGVVMSVKMKFVPGMREAHRTLAKRDSVGVRNVYDALGCVEEVDGGLDLNGECGSDDDSDEDGGDGDDSSDSSSSSESENGEEGDEDGVKGRMKDLLGEVQGYTERSGELHRKHRGIMQWKGARQVAWVGKGVEKRVAKAGDKVKEKLTGKGDGDGGQVVENEV